MDKKEASRIRQKRYRDKHPERCREACRKWRANHPSTFRASKQKWKEANPDWRNINAAKRRKKMKDLVFNAYGGYICAGIRAGKKCPEDDPEVMTLDHINNDGAQHRRELKKSGGISLFEKLVSLNFPPGFQVLCRNCNWRKHIATLKAQRLSRNGVGSSDPKCEAP